MIRFVTHNEIDKAKWDACMEQSQNGFIYGYSWYLDVACPNWNALIQDDYDAIFPLPTAYKYFQVAYQPFFTQQLGLFYADSAQAFSVDDFLHEIPKEYKYINICLNEYNSNVVTTPYKVTQRSNYILHLHRSYDELYKQFNDQTRRNVAKGHKNNLKIRTVDSDAVVDFYIKHKGPDTEALKPEHYTVLKELLKAATKQQVLTCYEVVDGRGDVLSCAAIYFHKNRIIYQLGASTADGRNQQSMSFLFDRIIFENCNQDKLFDFEGSDIPSVARYFAGFGSLNVKYNRVVANKLPWPLKLLKK